MLKTDSLVWGNLSVIEPCLTVKCPCNVFLRYSVTIIFAFLIIIIIIIMEMHKVRCPKGWKWRPVAGSLVVGCSERLHHQLEDMGSAVSSPSGEIGQHLAKIWANVWRLLFGPRRAYTFSTVTTDIQWLDRLQCKRITWPGTVGQWSSLSRKCPVTK